MQIPTSVKAALAALFLALAAWLGYEAVTPSTPTDPPIVVVPPSTDTLPIPPKLGNTPSDRLGVNYTLASDKLIQSLQPADVRPFTHARYFIFGEKDLEGGTAPLSAGTSPCIKCPIRS